MKKIFKKSLAIMVSAAICLTALIGCLSVSAAEGDAPVYTVVSAEGKKGETVGVNVTGADLTKICGQSVDIKFAAGLEIVKVYDNDEKRDLVLVNDETGGEYNILSNEDGTKTVRLVDIINFPTYGETPALETSSFNVTISVKIPADAADTEYPITFDESQFADLNEKWVYPTLNGGKITVVEDAPSCEHQWEAVSADPATEELNGLITFKCAKCEEEMTETVYYNKYSRPMYTSVSAESEILFCMGVRDETDLSRVGTAGGWSDLYFEFVQQRADGEKTSKIINYIDAEDTTMNSRDVYKFSYGVASPNLGDNITGYAYTYNSIDAKWYSGESLTSSVKQYTFKMLPTATELQKTVLVDMLYYGAAAQINFGYDVDNLVNASMVYEGTDYSTYATSGTTEVTDQKSMATSFTDEYPVTFSTFSIEAESKLIFNVAFQFGSKYYNQYIDEYDGLYVVIDYIDFNGQKQSVKYYNSTVSDSKHTFSLTDGTRKFALQFNDFTAADMRGLLTINVYKADGTKLTQDSTYSVQSYVYTARSGSASEQLLNTLNEMIQYGDSCKALLTSK